MEGPTGVFLGVADGSPTLTPNATPPLRSPTAHPIISPTKLPCVNRSPENIADRPKEESITRSRSMPESPLSTEGTSPRLLFLVANRLAPDQALHLPEHLLGPPPHWRFSMAAELFEGRPVSGIVADRGSQPTVGVDVALQGPKYISAFTELVHESRDAGMEDAVIRLVAVRREHWHAIRHKGGSTGSLQVVRERRSNRVQMDPLQPRWESFADHSVAIGISHVAVSRVASRNGRDPVVARFRASDPAVAVVVVELQWIT